MSAPDAGMPTPRTAIKKKMMRLLDTKIEIRSGKMVFVLWDRGLVRVMAEAEGYAMVRFPRAAPICVSLKKLSSK